jgi:hypothetical protein
LTHDPSRILESLRDHLTQPQTSISFLFGAGTSCAVRIPVATLGDDGLPVDPPPYQPLIPNVASLTEICRKEIAKLDPPEEAARFTTALATIEAEIAPKERPVNIEDILSCVRRKLQAVGPADKLAGLSRDELSLLEESIRQTIAAQVNPDSTSFPNKLPHEDFVRWTSRVNRKSPVEVFTTNYDILIETAFDAERVPSFDGFVGCGKPFFCHDSLARPESTPGAAWARIWKVHGSITWKLENVKGHSRVIRGEPSANGEMIMPSHHKYDESRKQPYAALLDRFTKVLDREDALLVVYGYSFSDEHINAIIFDALEARQRPHVVALQYADPIDGDTLDARARRQPNLMVLGPSVAIIGGVKGDWKLHDSKLATTFSNAFCPDPPLAEGGPPPGTGKFLLGDFAKFTDFLASLSEVN